MTDDDGVENRLSKFSNADRRAYRQPQAQPSLEQPGDPALADLLEHVIRDSGLADRTWSEALVENKSQITPEPASLHQRLIEELQTVQNQVWAEPDLEYAAPPPEAPLLLEEPAAAMLAMDPPRAATSLLDAIPEAVFEAPVSEMPVAAFGTIEEPANLSIAPVQQPEDTAQAALARKARALAHHSRGLASRMRIREWRRRRLALLSVIHRHVFDRNTENLLFCKTPPLEVYHTEETETGTEKSFVYQGPIPKMALDWALSALPGDLKRYAFVDFRAGNGRTLLLAARRNFEYAAGYAFDAENSETLEMNLAQYPRSYLSCRDVRALRGDRDGVTIPSQPAVLFFPDSLSAGHLDIILSYVTASLRIEPRPIYLIFENAGRERGSEQMNLFECLPLPMHNRAKAFLLGPVSIAVYRSRIEIAN